MFHKLYERERGRDIEREREKGRERENKIKKNEIKKNLVILSKGEGCFVVFLLYRKKFSVLIIGYIVVGFLMYEKVCVCERKYKRHMVIV